MAKKPTTRPTTPTGEEPKPQRKENLIERIADQVEAHFIEGAELATSTSSAETNVALAALGAIEGPREPKPKAEKKRDGGKRSKPRPQAR